MPRPTLSLSPGSAPLGLLLIASLCSALIALPATGVAATSKGLIQVKITDKRTGKPVKGAYIGVYGGRKNPGDRRTKADGRVVFSGLARKTKWNVSLGSVPSPYVLPEWRKTVDLSEDRVASFRLSLGTGSAIQGTVTDSQTGKPVVRACVGAFVGALGAPTRNQGAGCDDQTDAKGAYQISQLKPGQYMVGASEEDHASRLWPASNQQTLGQPVTVTATAITKGIDIRLDPYGVIKGRITNSTGAPVGGNCVQIHNPYDELVDPSDGSAASHAVHTEPDGSYAAKVAPGTYRVGIANNPTTYDINSCLTPRNGPLFWLSGTTDLSQAQPVNVSPGGTTAGIDITAPQGFYDPR